MDPDLHLDQSQNVIFFLGPMSAVPMVRVHVFFLPCSLFGSNLLITF